MSKTAHEIITKEWGYKQDPEDKLRYTLVGDDFINHIKFVSLKSLPFVRAWYEDSRGIGIIHWDENDLLVLAQYIRELKEGVYDE